MVWRFIRDCDNLVFFIWIRIINDFRRLTICRCERLFHSLINNVTIWNCLISSFWRCLVSNYFRRSFIFAFNIHLIWWSIITRFKSGSLSINCSSISFEFLIFLQINTAWCNCIFCLFLRYSWRFKMVVCARHIWLVWYSNIIFLRPLAY